jgi:CAAX prenyl protease-like protein
MLLRTIPTLSPATARVAPFVIFVALTSAQGWFGPVPAYWLYLIKTVLGLWMLIELRPLLPEMRWALSWEAVVVGIAIFAVWVGISRGWALEDSIRHAPVKPASLWDPPAQFGANSPLAWLFIATRILGSTFVVPPLEELFYRSFFYRYLAKVDFLSVPLNRFLPMPFLATSVIFGLVHNQWVAGILCGAAYQWLVIRKNRLGDAMTAHAITNFLLGVWVVWRGAWQFW